MEARVCLQCGEPLDVEWARSDQRFCGQGCKNRYHYRRYLQYHKKLYQQKKRIWERSPNGKRAGVPIRDWIKIFREEWYR